MMDAKEIIQSVGTILTNFLKTGSTSPNHTEEIKAQIYEIALPLITSPEEATENYKKVCKDFLTQTLKAKGLPTRAMFGGGENQSNVVSSSSKHIAQNFNSLRPQIISRYNWCIENYQRQAKIYQDEQLSQFHDLLMEFLNQVPISGTKDKLTKSKISEIKSELRHLTKWNQLFYTYKAASLPAELDHIFTLEEDPIAAIWDYSQLDEQGEYQQTYNHKERDGTMFIVRGNWAIQKGLMKVDHNRYIDEIDLPNQEIGCMCSYEYLYNLRDLPDDMLTEEGLSTLKRQKTASQTKNKPQKTNVSTSADAAQDGFVNRFLRWLGSTS